MTRRSRSRLAAEHSTEPGVEHIDVSPTEFEAILAKVESSSLDERTRRVVVKILRTYEWISRLSHARKLSLWKLQRLLFGAPTEKAKNVLPEDGKPDAAAQDGKKKDEGEDDSGPSAGTGAAPSSETPDQPPEQKTPGKGHGKNGADRYAGAERIRIPHPSLKAGDLCLECELGTLYQYGYGQVVRLFGRAPVEAKVYQPEKLRCSACQEIFTAPLPTEAGQHRHHHTARSLVGLLNYGAGVPFYRLEGLQAALGAPLPDATQWDMSEELGKKAHPIYRELIRQGAQLDLASHDDTKVRIQSLRRENVEGGCPDGARKGIQTTGIVLEPRIGAKGHRICLFVSGRNHAGENLAELFKKREPGRPAPIQVADALAANFTGSREFRAIIQKCLDHGRRKFVELVEQFPNECAHVIRELGQVYGNDAESRRLELGPEQRLAYHVEHTVPVLDGLKAWIEGKFERREVEPNSTLGHAFRYLLRHWRELTTFTRVAGVPLSSATVERLLKRAVLRRKNSLSYLTEAGAAVGDVLMSVIETARAAKINVLEYLNAIQEHAAAVRRDPGAWLPWNYAAALPAAGAP